MDAAFISNILSLIPDRAPHAHTGVPFLPEEGNSRYPERVRHLAGLLSWLSPLSALSKDDQKTLGLLNAAGRPIHAGEEAEAALDDDGEESLEYMQAETAVGVREEHPQGLA